MKNYHKLYEQLLKTRLKTWVPQLKKQTIERLYHSSHGDMEKWQNALAQLPPIQPSMCHLNQGTISIGKREDCNQDTYSKLRTSLKQFCPWRKGPYSIFGIDIDTEWRSDWKWQRLENHIEPLKGRRVLDVGCGNGYHCWRMAAEGARLVMGIDPTLLSVIQFHVIFHFVNIDNVYVLPLKIEDVPPDLCAFDTVFSMGILYHRRSPLDHLLELRGLLHSGGQLVLETLVIDGKDGEVLVPEGRYGKMRNVWFLPSCATLESWMKRCKFKDIHLMDVTKTSIEEQRATEWMVFESLKDFLHPDNPELTIEGLPAPKRAIFLAKKP